MPNERQQTGGRRQWGLTLLELLVAAVIMLLLLAILVPGLVEAKHAARRMGCAVRLRAVGDAANLYKTDEGKYPNLGRSFCAGGTDAGFYCETDTDCEGGICMPPPPTALTNMGKVADLLVDRSLGDPRMLYCPVSVEDDPYAPDPFKIENSMVGPGVMYIWKTGHISYIYLVGVTHQFPDDNGMPTYYPELESPDIPHKPNAVLFGDRTGELAPNMKHIPGSNHAREGGWFYFTGGYAEWWSWEQLTPHPTNRFIWYWPQTGG
jgi:type II secretory pathway pseudopilin PulG